MSVFRKEYRTLYAHEQGQIEAIKELAEALHSHLTEQNRETSLARTKLEECVMWAVKGITG